MSRKKKKQSQAPMPSSSVGLLRFFDEKTESLIKLRPEIVIVLAVALVVTVIIANAFLKGPVTIV